MTNVYDAICANSKCFDQLKFGDKGDIFIDYLCPIHGKRVVTYCHKNALFYVVSGTSGYDTSNHFFKAQEYHLFFVRKGCFIAHHYQKNQYRALVFMFDDDAITKLISEYSGLLNSIESDEFEFSTDRPIIELNSNPFIQSTFITSLEYLKNPTVESALSLEIKFKELFVNILRDKKSNAFSRYLNWLCSNPDVSFVQLMNENSHYNLSTHELARIACMSLSTFKREFTRNLNVTPGKWLRDKRLQRAKILLTNSDKTISEIAFSLNYNDTAAFSRSFKMATNKSPSEYRGKSPVLV